MITPKPKHELTYRHDTSDNDGPVTYIATLAFDDRCGNGHKTFSATCDEYRKYRQPAEPTVVHKQTRKTLWLFSCGCQHDIISKQFPELRHLIKWHLVSTNGPLHYLANAQFHVKEGNLEYARSTAVAPEATEDQLSNPQWLKDRLPGLLDDFRRDMEAAGFDWNED